jgi:site-specific recombinase XerD
MAIDILTIQHHLLLDSFLRALRAENLSKRTLETYGESVRQFIGFLASNGMP